MISLFFGIPIAIYLMSSKRKPLTKDKTMFTLFRFFPVCVASAVLSLLASAAYVFMV